MSTVLVVDDEPQIRTALHTALTQEGHEVLLARSGLQAVEISAGRSPDLAIVDLRLPDIDGMELTRRLRRWTQAPILILSGVGEESRKVQALDAGADDYLQKPFGVDELKARVRALQRRTPGAGPVVLEYPGLTVDLVTGCVTCGGAREVRLTPLEWQLLERLATNPGKLMTHRRLAAEVWGDTYGDEMRQTLRTHLHSLRSKLGDSASQPVYIRTESGAGYRWVAPPLHSAGLPSAQTGEGVSDGHGVVGPVSRDDDTVHDLLNALTAMLFGLDRISRASNDVNDAAMRDALLEGVRRCRRTADRAVVLAERLGVDEPPLVPAGTKP